MAERALAPLLEGGAFFECPRWRDGRWWVSDFYREAVFTVTTHGDEELAPLQDMLPQIVVGPDGCTLDAEGHIWSADEAGGRCIRIAPGGTIVDEIRTPEGFGCYACALGGADGRTLLVCAAPDFLEGNRREAREAVVLSTTVDVGHAGLP